MDYELAKKLKNARFPKGINLFTAIEQVDNEPTLSELIEACGDHAGLRLEWKRIHNNWRASAFNNNEVHADGSTPDEAVANLWFALNPIST